MVQTYWASQPVGPQFHCQVFKFLPVYNDIYKGPIQAYLGPRLKEKITIFRSLAPQKQLKNFQG